MTLQSRLILLILLLASLCFSSSASDHPIMTNGFTAFSTNSIDRHYPFSVGEKLVYKIYWGIINVGEASMSVEEEVVSGDGTRMLRFVARTRTSSFFDNFYIVDDTVQSYVNSEELFSYRYIEDRREGSHRYDEVTDFDYENHRGLTLNRRKSKTKVFEVPRHVYDALSCAYYLRSLPYHKRADISVPTVADEKVYDVTVTERESKKMDTKFGTYPAICFEPEASYKGIFQRRGKMLVWITDDAYRIPLLMTAKVPFGSVRAVLVDVIGVNGWKQK